MRHRGLLVSFYQEIFRQQFVKYTPCCYHSVFSVSTNVLIWFSPSKSRHYILWRFWFKTISMTWLTKTPFISIFIYQISNDVTLLVWQILPRTIAALLTWRFLEWFFSFLQKSLFCHYCTPFVMHFQFPNVHLENGVVQFFDGKYYENVWVHPTLCDVST